MSPAELKSYNEAHPSGLSGMVHGAIDGVRDFADRHSKLIANVAIGIGVAAAVAGLFLTGPVGLVVLGATSGAFLSGGLAIGNNTDKDGKVNWGAVGKKFAIGGVTGAIGGAASSFLKFGVAGTATAFANRGMQASSRFVSNPAGATAFRASYAVANKFGNAAKSFEPQLGKVGTEVVSNGTSGAINNTINYYTSEGAPLPNGRIACLHRWRNHWWSDFLCRQ